MIFSSFLNAPSLELSANSPLKTDLIPHEDSGLHDTLQALLPNNYTNELLQEILTRLWYIWKARNDFRFNDKKWSISPLVRYAME